MGVLGQPGGQQLRRCPQPSLPPVREDAGASAVASDSEALLDGRPTEAKAAFGGGVGHAGLPGLLQKQGLTWRRVYGLLAAAGLASMVGLALVSAARAGAAAPRHGDTERGGDAGRREAAAGLPQYPGRVGPCSAALLEQELCPLRSLFDDPDVHAVAAANILKVGEGLLESSDQDMVTQSIAEVFAEVSSILLKRAAPVAQALSQIDLNTEDKDALLVHLRLLSDQKVRGFGLDVARAIRESPSPEPDHLAKHIQERLVPLRGEIAAYSTEVIPSGLLTLWGKGREWSMTLDPINIRSMESVSGKFADSYQPEKQMAMKAKVEAVRDAALETAKSLLDFLLLCITDVGDNYSTDLGDTMTIAGDAPLSWPCQLDGEKDSQLDFDKGLICPLKFGAQGLDAMRVLMAARVLSQPN